MFKKNRKLYKILEKVNSYSQTMKELGEEELKGKTTEFKARFQDGESLDSLLPEAFAAMREAIRRIKGIYLYDVQVLGGIVLHQGKLAQMKTGEGKTLTAVLPLYLNALTGKMCMLVTANDYLARRDGMDLRPVFNYMGISVGIAVGEEEGVRLTTEQKQQIYASDVVYITQGSAGFDYLIENLVSDKSQKYLREYYYVIIDEVDDVLLDSAQTPLVIAGSPRVQSNFYAIADYFITTMVEDVDYEYDEDDNDVWLTEQGLRNAEKFYGVPRLYCDEHFDLVRYTILALRAHFTVEEGVDYIVEDGVIQLLDNKVGRVIRNTSLKFGQHQAIEEKEKVKLTADTRTIGTITFQSFFGLFPKVAGMSGTILSDREEMSNLYGLQVVDIPTNKPNRRIDHKDCICSTRELQIQTAIEHILEIHESHRPVLIVADCIDTSEEISTALLEHGVAHNLLNAYYTAKEALIIKEAGRWDAVTVATAIAGRGTDISLTDEVKEIGGLYVVGIGRMDNNRLEMQARGRSGRQGDPGDSMFYVSLEDDVIEQNGPDWLEKYKETDKFIRSPRIIRAIKKAQMFSIEGGRAARKHTMDYDVTSGIQREYIYGLRNKLLFSEDDRRDDIEQDTVYFINQFLDSEEELNCFKVRRFVMDNFSYSLDYFKEDIDWEDRQAIFNMLLEMTGALLDDKFAKILPKDKARLYRESYLSALDEAWIEQVDYLQQISAIVGSRHATQESEMVAYDREAFNSFDKMIEIVKIETIRNIYLSNVEYNEKNKLVLLMP